MARRITPSQLRSRLRQLESKQRQAVQKYNHEVRQYNQKVKRSIDQYNREVRSYNARRRAHYAHIKAALDRLSRTSFTVKYSVLCSSTIALNEAYNRLEEEAQESYLTPEHNTLIDYAEKENTNSFTVANVLLSEPPGPEAKDDNLANTKISTELREISSDLDDRWNGAVFALSPNNPDAARHFCTSSREIFNIILDLKAPITDVLARTPDCPKTPDGTPTRRARIYDCLVRKSINDKNLENFIEGDIQNIIDLFNIFNAGTHGPAGKYGLQELFPIKQRVEDGIRFLAKIVG